MGKKKEVLKTVERADSFAKVRALTKDLNKHYGSNLLKSGKDIPVIHKVPFGEPALDYVSDGGIPIGRFTELLGQEHSGKTRNALKGMGNFQKYCFSCHTPFTITAVWETTKEGEPNLVSCKCSNCSTPETKIQVMIDIEGTTDPTFMKNFDIDIKGIIYVRTDMPSQAVGIMDAYLRSPDIGMILMDSVGSMGSDKEVEQAIEDNKMNQNALFLNKAMRKWQAALNSNTNETGKENGATPVIVNQSYMSIGIYSTDIPQGGRGLRHGKGLSLKTRIREINRDSNTKEVFGVHVVMKNEKNKTGIPYRQKEYYLNLDPRDTEVGYCQTNVTIQLIEMAIEMGIIEQRGAWFYYEDDKWNGKAKLMDDMPQKAADEVNRRLTVKE